MSDLGRKSMGEQVGDKLKPDSQKTTTEQLGDTVTGVTDRVAGAVQPNSQKSTTQQAGDNLRSGSDNASNQGKGLAQGAADTVTGAAQTVTDTVGGLLGGNKDRGL